MKSSRMMALSLASACGLSLAQAVDPTYHVIDIGLPPTGAYGTFGGGYYLNDNGEVAANFNDQGSIRPMYWSQSTGTMTLGTFGSVHVWPYGITNSGVIYGNEGAQAFNWSVSGGYHDFRPIIGVNAQIWTTVSRTEDFIFGAGDARFIWQNGAYRSANPEVGGQSINQSAMLAGYGLRGSGDEAFLWNETTGTTWLGFPGGYEQSFGKRINGASTVVGDAFSPSLNPNNQAAIYRKGSWTLLGTLSNQGQQYSSGTALNDSDWVVGRSTADDGLQHAFLWSDGLGMRNLETLTDSSGVGWRFTSGEEINEPGQILVLGTYGGSTDARLALLTPVPEPASLAVLTIGAIAVLRRRGASRK